MTVPISGIIPGGRSSIQTNQGPCADRSCSKLISTTLEREEKMSMGESSFGKSKKSVKLTKGLNKVLLKTDTNFMFSFFEVPLI